MELLKNLKGEVKKFELEALLVTQAFSTEFLKGGEYLEPIHHELMQLNDIGHFYTQPLKPEMIEKYFEGFDEGVFHQTHDTCYNYDIGDNRIDMYMNSQVFSINGINTIFPKTLSDFIDACLNSDIKLNWKSN